MSNHQIISKIVGLSLLGLASTQLQAMIVTPTLEALRISMPDNGDPLTVMTQNTYTDLIPICVYALPTADSGQAATSRAQGVVRIDNITTHSFDVRVQTPQNVTVISPGDVYCVISEQGEDVLPDTRLYEADTIESDGTNGSARSWETGSPPNGAETGVLLHTNYPPESQPTVLGQVISSADQNFSVFWSFDCENRSRPPFTGDGLDTQIDDGFCIGKHVGQISGPGGNRNTETLGYFVVAEGITSSDTDSFGTFGGINYRVDLGTDSIRGVGDIGTGAAFTYNLEAHYDFAVATQSAEDGGQGGWATLYGDAPLAGNNIVLAIDEETIAGDISRTHTQEQVGYWAFSGTDRGDAPSSYSSASHQITGILSLGSIASGDPDAEDTTAEFSVDADADDAVFAGQVDDDDGVLFRSPAGSSYSIFADVQVINLKGQNATVCAWLDGSNDGSINNSFDSQEGQCQPSNTSGQLTFQWTDLPNDGRYETFARFRITTDSLTEANATANTPASDGEVEDYKVVFDFRPTAVTIGEIGLKRLALDKVMDDLDFKQMTALQLGNFLESWRPFFDTEDLDLDHSVLIRALRDYLDPDGDGYVLQVTWDTLEERGSVGFYVDRRSTNGSWFRVNDRMLPAMAFAPLGAEYKLFDRAANDQSFIIDGSYHYRLLEVETSGRSNSYGPFIMIAD